VYSESRETHVEHLRSLLEIMQCNQLYASLTKCLFGVDQVEYLGHIISYQGVSTDPAKIEAPRLFVSTAGSERERSKGLRGFLGLTFEPVITGNSSRGMGQFANHSQNSERKMG